MERYSKLYFSEDEYVDFDNRTIVISKNTYDLTNKQFKFLEFLSRHDSYVNNEEIESYLDTSRAVIRNIVSKLKNECQLSNYIDNKKDYGYKLLIPSDAPDPEYITYNKRDLVEIMYDGINFEVSQVYLDKLAILEEEIDNYSKSYHELIKSNHYRNCDYLIDYYDNKLRDLVNRENELRLELEHAKENNLCSKASVSLCDFESCGFILESEKNQQLSKTVFSDSDFSFAKSETGTGTGLSNIIPELESSDSSIFRTNFQSEKCNDFKTNMNDKFDSLVSKLSNLRETIDFQLKAPKVILSVYEDNKEFPYQFDTINTIPYTIGRSNDSAVDLVLNDCSISNLHATITFTNGKYYIVDNDSTNGTYINDIKIPTKKESLLNDGDEIKLGKTKILFIINKKEYF